METFYSIQLQARSTVRLYKAVRTFILKFAILGAGPRLC